MIVKREVWLDEQFPAGLQQARLFSHREDLPHGVLPLLTSCVGSGFQDLKGTAEVELLDALIQENTYVECLIGVRGSGHSNVLSFLFCSSGNATCPSRSFPGLR